MSELLSVIDTTAHVDPHGVGSAGLVETLEELYEARDRLDAVITRRLRHGHRTQPTPLPFPPLARPPQELADLARPHHQTDPSRPHLSVARDRHVRGCPKPARFGDTVQMWILW
jgi:hypothetical protein